jgi:hypothetical protein
VNDFSFPVVLYADLTTTSLMIRRMNERVISLSKTEPVLDALRGAWYLATSDPTPSSTMNDSASGVLESHIH